MASLAWRSLWRMPEAQLLIEMLVEVNALVVEVTLKAGAAV